MVSPAAARSLPSMAPEPLVMVWTLCSLHARLPNHISKKSAGNSPPELSAYISPLTSSYLSAARPLPAPKLDTAPSPTHQSPPGIAASRGNPPTRSIPGSMCLMGAVEQTQVARVGYIGLHVWFVFMPRLTKCTIPR